MRISDKQISQVLRAYTEQARRQKDNKPIQQQKPTARAGHEVKFSAQSQELYSMLQALKALPEADDARVQELKAQIEQGKYNVPSSEVAKRLLARELADRLE